MVHFLVFLGIVTIKSVVQRGDFSSAVRSPSRRLQNTYSFLVPSSASAAEMEWRIAYLLAALLIASATAYPLFSISGSRRVPTGDDNSVYQRIGQTFRFYGRSYTTIRVSRLCNFITCLLERKRTEGFGIKLLNPIPGKMNINKFKCRTLSISASYHHVCYFCQLQIYNNGYVSLGGGVTGGCTPRPFPFGGAPMIAPYWADVDTRGTGSVYYKSSTSSRDLNRAAGLISSTYRTSFRPNRVYIVTWYRVGAYYRSRSPVSFVFHSHVMQY